MPIVIAFRLYFYIKNSSYVHHHMDPNLKSRCLIQWYQIKTSATILFFFRVSIPWKYLINYIWNQRNMPIPKHMVDLNNYEKSISIKNGWLKLPLIQYTLFLTTSTCVLCKRTDNVPNVKKINSTLKTECAVTPWMRSWVLRMSNNVFSRPEESVVL